MNITLLDNTESNSLSVTVKSLEIVNEDRLQNLILISERLDTLTSNIIKSKVSIQDSLPVKLPV